ncbi:MAG: hypothetical protein A2Y97_09195 [Nitrospirae bacterium RBG_13_39_12]|nr:MAG: hypothetical protein A2Y97_09195 [Nitrospirae bacterium RBG_13_39_12]
MLNCQAEVTGYRRVQAIMKAINDIAIQYGLPEWTLIMFDSQLGEDFEIISNMEDELSLAPFKQILLRMVKMCGQFEHNGRLDS